VALMTGAALAYGVALPAAKAALGHVSPLQVLFWTRVVGLAVLGALVVVRRTPVTAPGAGRAGVVLGAVLFASYALLLAGLDTTPASTSGVILGLYVVCTPIIARLIMREPLRPAVVLAAAICTGGVAIAAGGPGAGGKGSLLIVGAALATALHTVLLTAASRRWPTAPLVLGQTAMAAALALVALRGHVGAGDAADAVVPLLVGGVFPPLVAAGAQIRAQRTLSAGLGAVILALEPVFAALLAIVLLGEPITRHLVVGALVVACGIALALQRGARPSVASGSL